MFDKSVFSAEEKIMLFIFKTLIGAISLFVIMLVCAGVALIVQNLGVWSIAVFAFFLLSYGVGDMMVSGPKNFKSRWF